MNNYHRIKRDVIGAYRSAVVRTYCTLRFRIMNMRILEELAQYLPYEGRLLDLGCGFGLFSLYFALEAPGREIVGYDLSARRLDMARASAVALGLADRTTFLHQDVVQLRENRHAYQAAYMLDILHHVPPQAHEEILMAIYEALASGGTLLIKDIDTRPRWKVAFTWVLDMLMSPAQPPNYISRETLKDLLTRIGFEVRTHALLDILPYPHVLYVCRKINGSGGSVTT